MTDLLHAPDGPNGEQLQLDIVGDRLLTPQVVPVDMGRDMVHSPAYQQLESLRNEAYARRRSGARAIAREALAALRGGAVSREEYAMLFQDHDRTASESHEPAFEDLSHERPPRELDWAERAAGEGVRRPSEDE